MCSIEPNPRVFGPRMWFTLHTVSFFYPEQPTSSDMKAYKDFYDGFSRFIPCKKCRNHYELFVHNHPLDGVLNSRDLLSRWVVHLHNSVNTKLGKSQMNYEDVVKMYRKEFQRDKSIWQNNNILIASMCCLSAFIYWRYMR